MQQSHSTYRARQHVERIVFSIALGIVATGCYGGIAVEPRHEPRNEEHREERSEVRHEHQEQREEHHDRHHDDDEHRD